jgi:hypothetical protein
LCVLHTVPGKVTTIRQAGDIGKPVFIHECGK